jgi:hypothetical protein
VIETTTETYLNRLLADSGTLELCRFLNGKPADVGWYDDAQAALTDALQMASRGSLFTTLNPIDLDAVRDYLAERRQKNPDGTYRTRDEHVTGYRRLFIDLDPVRPANVSSTDQELQAARDRAQAVREYLAGLGWPIPANAISGNGAHLQFRIALPCETGYQKQIKAILRGLDERFSDENVKLDTGVHNPARLAPLYGSIKRKGPNTPDRPHRQTRIWIPTPWEQVSRRQITDLADAMARRQARTRPEAGKTTPGSRPQGLTHTIGRGDYRTLDIVALFKAHGLYLGHERDNIHRVLCPWLGEHTTGSSGTIVFEADGGWPGFRCQHSHCAHRRIQDVIAFFPDAERFCARPFTPARSNSRV